MSCAGTQRFRISADFGEVSLTAGLSDNFILMGWSSGGNIALNAALNLLRDEPRFASQISQLILLSSWIDLSMRVLKEGPYQIQQNSDTIAAGADPLTQMSRWYLPDDAIGSEPEFCPVQRSVSELNGLPPVTIIVGGCEVLLGDSIFMADMLKNAEVPTQLLVLQGQTHNYLVFEQLSRDGVFVPDLIAQLIQCEPVANMVGDNGLGLRVKRFNATTDKLSSA